MSSHILSNNNVSIRRKFFRYLVPSVVSMWVFSLYTMIDGIFVSKGSGELSLASVNISMPYINFIFAISILFSTGASTIIAVFLGKKDIRSANKVFTLNIVTIIILSIIILILSILYLDKLAIFLGATNSTINMVKEFLGIIMFFNVFFIISYSLEVIIKTDGFPFMATFGVIISSLINIVLDYFFVLKFGWGVRGAAIATGSAQAISSVFFLAHFFKRKSTLKFSKFRFNFRIIRKIILIGIPDAITELSSGIVILLFNLCIQKYIGENGIIYYSVINYINILVLMTMIGITQGIQPIVSYYYGAKNIINIKRLLKMGLVTITIATVIVVIGCNIFTNSIVSLFINSNEIFIFNETSRVFKIFAFSFLFLGFNVIISGFFVAVENPKISTIISLGRGFIIVTASLFIMIFLFGRNGIWYTTIVSEFICLLISITLLKINFKHIKKKMK